MFCKNSSTRNNSDNGKCFELVFSVLVDFELGYTSVIWMWYLPWNPKFGQKCHQTIRIMEKLFLLSITYPSDIADLPKNQLVFAQYNTKFVGLSIKVLAQYYRFFVFDTTRFFVPFFVAQSEVFCSDKSMMFSSIFYTWSQAFVFRPKI